MDRDDNPTPATSATLNRLVEAFERILKRRGYFKHEGKDEFYDLKNDPQETRNLITSENAHVIPAIAELDRELRAAMQVIEDRVD